MTAVAKLVAPGTGGTRPAGTGRDSGLRRFLRRNEGQIYVLPAFAVLAAFILYPLLSTLALSLTSERGAYVGMRNFTEMLESERTARSTWNTVYYVGFSIVFELLFGIAAGILLNQRFRGQALMRSLVLIPWVIPEIVAATTWAWMFHADFGIVNYMLSSVGIIEHPISWLTGPRTVLPALTAIHVWKVFPLVAIMILAGLQAVPQSLYEAARIDGASFWDEVRYVMLPELRPIIASITLLLMVNGLNSITIVYATTKGGPADRSMLTSIQIYKEAFEYFQFNQASALSIMFFCVTACVIVIYIRWTASHVRY